MPALDNPHFETHLEVTELDLQVAVGVDITTDKVNNLKRLDRSSQSRCAINCYLWSVQAGILSLLRFPRGRTGLINRSAKRIV